MATHQTDKDTALTPGKVPVTVLVPTKNEAANLPRCLDHLRWADDVVIIDSNSTDATQMIARAYGARVITFNWNGQWPKKRNWALRNADLKHQWILMVDADEWIVPELAAEIAEAIKSETNIGYWINRKFIFMGGWLKHCGYYPSWNLRLLKRGHGEFERLTELGDTKSGDNEIHEHVVLNGPAGRLRNDMLHLAFPDISTFIEKHNRYSNWEAAVQYHQHATTNQTISNSSISRRRWAKEISRKFPFRPALRFIYSYILRLGFLDGYRGFIFSRLIATYEFLSVAKFNEMRFADRDRKLERQLSRVPEFDWKAADTLAR